MRKLSNTILLKIDDDSSFEKNKKEIQIGKYLQIKEGNLDYVICVIQNIRVNENEKYIINTQPIGVISNKKFQQGSASLPSPTEYAYIIDEDVMKSIFNKDSIYSFELGRLIMNKQIAFHINGNRFFSKHIAIVGSTGSGKSCTVAKNTSRCSGYIRAKKSI